jgi:hypothetical protein
MAFFPLQALDLFFAFTPTHSHSHNPPTNNKHTTTKTEKYQNMKKGLAKHLTTWL